MAERSPEPDFELDLTAYVCPMTYVRTKLKLEQMGPGQVLAVLLKGEATRNVPRSALQEGHEVLWEAEEGEATRFFIRKKG